VTNTDVVVVLPGIMGSTLAERDGNPVWAPSARTILRAIRRLHLHIKDFRLPDGIGDDHPDDGVQPVALFPDVHVIPGIWTPIKGYDRLVALLNRLGYHEQAPDHDAPPGNLVAVPYDWRLSVRYNGRWLAGIVEPALERWRAQGGPYTDAQLVFVCHSMGGLVARWYIEKCGGAAHTRKLITLGTPYRGAAKAVEQLVNGVHKGLGVVSVDLTDFARSLPSTYHLLPEYACIDTGSDLRKTTTVGLPDLDTGRLADAMRFHTDLQAAEAARPECLTMTHAIVGVRQPTWTTVRITPDNRVEPLDTIGGDNDYGDATVPLAGAIGYNQPQDTPLVHRVADQHGNLQRNQAALDEIEEIITTTPVRRKAPQPVTIRATIPDLITIGEDLPIAVDLDDDTRHAITITITNEAGKLLHARQPKIHNGHADTTFTNLPPGAHTIHITGAQPSSPIAPVTATTLIWTDTPS
jgi:pimeloyl-ACP methyl ester carboxylesterase